MFINVRSDKSRIYGYSMSNKDSLFTTLSAKGIQTDIKTVKIPPEQKWAGMELSTDESCMIVANVCKRAPREGQNSEFMRIMAIRVSDDNQISTICYKDFDAKNFCQVQFMRKVKGYDIFVLASKGSIAVLELKNKEGISLKHPRNSHRSINSDTNKQQKEFIILNFYENLFNSYIYEVAIFNDLMIPVALGGKNDHLKVIKLNIGTDGGDEGAKSTRRTLRGANTNRSLKSGQKKRKSEIFQPYIEKWANHNIKINFIQTEIQSKSQISSNFKLTYFLEGSKRIAASASGNTLYFGGKDGLQMLVYSKSKQQFRMTNKSTDLSYFALRPTPSNHIIVQARGSNSILILDKKLMKHVDFPGRENDFSNPEATKIAQSIERQPHFSNEGYKMIWFGDKWSISILDMTDLSQNILDNGLKSVLQDQNSNKIPEPVTSIADFEKNKVLVLYNLQYQNILVWHEEMKETQMWLASEKFPQFEKITFMDITKDKKHGIIGGIVKGECSLALFSFNTDMTTVAQITIPTHSEHEQNGVTGLRVSSQNDGLILCATRSDLCMLQVDTSNPSKSQIVILKHIELGCDMGKFCDICISGNKVYLAGHAQDNGFLSLEFGMEV